MYIIRGSAVDSQVTQRATPEKEQVHTYGWRLKPEFLSRPMAGPESLIQPPYGGFFFLNTTLHPLLDARVAGPRPPALAAPPGPWISSLSSWLHPASCLPAVHHPLRTRPENALVSCFLEASDMVKMPCQPCVPISRFSSCRPLQMFRGLDARNLKHGIT